MPEQWVTIKDASEILGIPYQTLLRIINIEEAKGNIEVRQTPRDRRSRLVEVEQVRRLLEAQ